MGSPGGLATVAVENALPPHLRLLNREIVKLVQAVVSGEGEYADYKGMIVNMPPQHGKSELCSHFTPAWALGRWPWLKIILASYEARFAESWGQKARDVMEELGAELFDVALDPNTNTRSHWQVRDLKGRERRRGYMATAGAGGAITGKGAHLFVIDDPFKDAQEANSALRRQQVWDWWLSVARTRLQPTGKVLLVQTRWHEDDLAGRLIKEMEHGGDRWKVISFPAIAEEHDVLGRQTGDALWPGRYDLPYLEATRVAQGPYWFAAMYQQRPEPAGGGILKRAWWRWYNQATRPPVFNRIFQAWDTANKEKELNDYSACTTIGEREGRWYVLEVWRGRLEFPELVAEIRARYQKWRPERVRIEDAASGTQALQTLRRQSGVPIVPVAVDRDKVQRARVVTGYMEAGLVYLPEDAPWLADFLDEATRFPAALHDDQVDSYVHCLAGLIGDFETPASQSVDTIGYQARPRVTAQNPLGLDLDDPKYRDADAPGGMRLRR